MRIELPEGMAQLLQKLADKLAHLAQGMIRRNAPLRLDIREHPALIEKLSAHRKSSCRISRESESSPLRFGEVFPQTARSHEQETRIRLDTTCVDVRNTNFKVPLIALHQCTFG